MNTEQIENRIRALMAERTSLEASHETAVQQNQKTNQEFQQTVMKNQSRFAQLTGGITELQQLLEPKKGTNNDNSIFTPGLSDRASDVRLSEQSQGR